jgi:CubicO group peptidase (beta-lactamase class C family)
VGVLDHGQNYTAGFGVTNVDHPLLVTDETLFQIGSITKTFVATLIMRLAEMGKLDLNAAVRIYLPDFKLADEHAAANATIRHLLTHTGNWVGDFFIDTGEGDDASARYMARMADLPQPAPLGSVFSYNNAGFYLAGHLIEAVTGKSFDAVLRELVWAPLGLENCYLRPTDVMTRRFVAGHREEAGQAVVARPWPLPRAAWAAGGIITNVKEMLRYARFHMGDGRAGDGAQLLSPASLSQMQTPQVKIWGDAEAVGLAWMLNDNDGVRRVSHGGGTVGQISQLTLIPERQFALAIVTNSGNGGAVNLAAYRWCLQHFLGVKPAIPAPIESPAEKLAQYVGRYTRPMNDVELRLEEGKLMVHVTPKAGFPTEETPLPPAPPPMTLALCARDRLLVLDGPMKDTIIDVIRNDKGAIRWIRAGRIYNPAP